MFDFDGVLVDTLMLSYEISGEVNTDVSLDEYKNAFNGNIHAALGKGKFKMPHPNFPERYHERTRELLVPSEIQTLVRDLSTRATLAVVSSTESRSIKKILERASLLDCFSDILGSDVDSSKVAKIKSLLTMYSINPPDTVFVTDTCGDVYEARETGVPAITVTWGFQTREMLEKSQPFRIVDTVRDLEEALAAFLVQ